MSGISRRSVLAGVAGLGLTPARAAEIPRRAAFVLGLGRYTHAPALDTPRQDAFAIAQQFRQRGYATTLQLDLSRDAILKTVVAFRKQAVPADTVAVYLAGHGVQTGAETYLAPIDTPMTSDAFWQDAIPLSGIMQTLSDRVRTKLFFVDLCREPWVGQTRPPAVQPKPLAGHYCSYATRPGEIAVDNVNGRSPFAHALLHVLTQPQISLDDADRQIRLNTMRLTQGRQIPWSSSTLLTPVTL